MTQERPIFEIRPMTDRASLEELLRLRWSDGTIFVRGRLLAPQDVEALGAYLDGRLQGVATWRIEQGTLYLLTLNNITDRRGVGVALLGAMLDMGRRKGFPFMRAMLSNDNIPALRFYQKRGFRIVAVHSGVVDMMRSLKPSIPEIGFDGIPMRDEIELEIVL
ncbi:MAG TPA: GNAT family N-acetyltransferase [Xanthobacteraceae bacterium]|nr:GNAT family N-acetyltransferase [Xanthobacteraceae bacterium]